VFTALSAGTVQAQSTPAVPSGLTVTVVSSTQHDLAWTDNSNNEDGFKIYRSTDNANFSYFAGVGTNTTTYTRTGTFDPETVWYYRVTAYNSTGESAFSNTASTAGGGGGGGGGGSGVTVNENATFPSSPTILVVTPSSTDTGRDVRSSRSPAQTFKVATAFQLDKIYIGYSNGVTGNAVTLRVFPVADVSATGANVTPSGADLINVTYTPSSSVNTGATKTTLEFDLTGANEVTLAATSGNAGYAVLFERADSVLAFKWLLKTGDSFANGRAFVGGGDTSSTLDFAMALTAGSGGGPTAPSAPSGLAATSVSSSQINLSWTDTSSNEDGFKIERSPDNSTFTEIATVGANIGSYQNTGLNASTTYYYRVRAYNAGGNSAYSATASATTQADTPTPSGIILTSSGQATSVIVRGANDNAQAIAAADLLQKKIALISGATLPIYREDAINASVSNGQVTSNQSVSNYVLVGDSNVANQLGVSSAGLAGGSIKIRTVGNALILLGPTNVSFDQEGNRYAVLTFLEDYLGYRYLWPGKLGDNFGEIAPARPTIEPPTINVTFTPPVTQRILRMQIVGSPDPTWLNTLGFTVSDYQAQHVSPEAGFGQAEDVWYARQPLTGNLYPGGAHAFTNYWSQFGNTNPGWFAVQNPSTGSRDQDGGSAGVQQSETRARLCKSNSQLINHIAQEKIAELNANSNALITLGSNDGGTPIWCFCETNALGQAGCKSLDNASAPLRTYYTNFEHTSQINYPAMTDRVLWFRNQIIAQIRAVHPNARFILTAYEPYDSAPISQNLTGNVVMNLVFWPSFTHDQARTDARASWDNWSNKASTSGTTDFFARPNVLVADINTASPLGFWHRAADDMNYFLPRKLKGCEFDSDYNNWAMRGLSHYVLAKAMWKPTLNVDAVVDDYCLSAFGSAAAGYVKTYFTRIEQITNVLAAKNIGAKDDLERSNVLNEYMPTILNELRGYLDSAASAAAGSSDPLHARRVAFIRAGFNFLEIQAEVERYYRYGRNPNEGTPYNLAIIQDLETRRNALMRDIFQNNHFAVNVYWVANRDYRMDFLRQSVGL
jgi:hypothetical protein